MSGFYDLHADLPRQGPGEAADVLWALGQLPVPPARVLDAGCGPGADAEVLGEALPSASIVALDKHPGFVAEAAARLDRFGPRVSAREGDFTLLAGEWDLVWCAGAIYFMGVTEGLGRFGRVLAEGGHVVFSEPVLAAGASRAAQEFWAGYPVADAAGIDAQVRAAGFRTLATRAIVGAPWQAYYAPLEERITRLRPGADAELTMALDDAEREIALWRTAPDEVAYLLSVVAPG